MPVTHLNERIARELDGNIILEVPGFVEHIFPDECLPLPAEAILQSLTGIRDSHSLFQHRNKRSAEGSWATFPQFIASEEHPPRFASELARFLNHMGDTIRDVCRLGGGSMPKKKRRWSSAYTSMPLDGACLSENPGLVLFDRKAEEEGWHTALSTAEIVLTNDYDLTSSLHRLIHSGSDVFVNQDDRRFQICFTISDRQFRLVLIDHCGVVTAQSFDIDEQPGLFVRSVAGLMFSSRPTMGFDTTITTLKNGQRQIKVGQDVYDIVKRLSISRDVRGKATVCWHARRNGADFVIKDNWSYQGSAHTEAKILELAQDIPGITKLVALETVTIDRKLDSTATLRSIVPVDHDLPPVGVRLHKRLVMTPFAQKIGYFRSKKELISVFIDAIEVHRSLVDKNILHADISASNIMIAEPESETPVGLRMGLLIDVDNSLVVDNIGYWVGLVGTFVFMSSAILVHGSSTKHKATDDLQSFFWVLIYMCVRYAGPDNTTRADYFPTIDSMPAFDPDQSNAYNTGRCKRHILSSKATLEREILPNFTVYFEGLKPFITELRDTFMKNKGKFAYDTMLDVLRRARDALPLAEQWSPQDDPEGYGLHPKRPREESEGEGGSESRCAPQKKAKNYIQSKSV
ncbi:hypothetical protein B0H11DRAFT_1958844 [Mycena galericulata]|nr:hypothetical protein B0H11DRAFT_1958844 [Mycena galericulata]